jgi:hypothetical protein
VYRVEKSKNCNRSGEALSISDLKRLSLFITSTTPVESLRIIENPTTITRNICLFEFRHPEVIDHRKHSFEERTQPLRNISQRDRAGCTDKSRFNWVFMELPNSTKKRETRATLNTFQIMSLIKGEMKFPDQTTTNHNSNLQEEVNRKNLTKRTEDAQKSRYVK